MDVAFAELPYGVRMRCRDIVTTLGCTPVSYDGPWMQIAVCWPLHATLVAIRTAGLDVQDSATHYFPLGSDHPRLELRHDGFYPGSKGFWCYTRVRPISEALLNVSTS